MRALLRSAKDRIVSRAAMTPGTALAMQQPAVFVLRVALPQVVNQRLEQRANFAWRATRAVAPA